MPTADHLWSTDFKWWRYHIADVSRDFEGQCYTQEVQWPQNQRPEAWGIKCFKANTGADGLSRDPDVIHTGLNSGFAAINLAYHLARDHLPARILLLGYDMKVRGEQRHWFGAHPNGLEMESNYASFANKIATIKPAEYDLEIWNVTRDTALQCFPVYDFDEVCQRLSSSAPGQVLAA